MFSTLVASFEAPDGAPRLGVVAKRAYRIEPGKSATALSDRCAINEQAAWSEPVVPDGACEFLADSDMPCFVKPLTDVLVSGAAHAQNGSTLELECGVAVGPVRRSLRVRGDRKISGVTRTGLRVGRTEAFTSMPLTWRRAYGGRDHHAEAKLHADLETRRAPQTVAEALAAIRAASAISYPRNACGRGFFIDVDRERLVGEALPNFDDPDDPVVPERLLARDPGDWLGRPVPAGLGPIDPLTFPRCAFSFMRPDVKPTDAIREFALRAVATDDLAPREIEDAVNPRFFNAAAAGMAIARLGGDETVRLWRLHRRHDFLEFSLPGVRPRVLIEPPNTRAFELEPVLATVLVEPDADRVVLTWAASMPVAGVYPPAMCKEMRHAVQ